MTKGNVDLFRNSSVGVIAIFVVRISAVQFTQISSGGSIHSQTPCMHQQQQFDPEETTKHSLPIGLSSQEQLEASRHFLIGLNEFWKQPPPQLPHFLLLAPRRPGSPQLPPLLQNGQGTWAWEAETVQAYVELKASSTQPGLAL